MSPISNAEKQARFRKKEELKKFADQCFREAQCFAYQHPKKGPALLAQLQSMSKLPSAWTDEDLEFAYARIHQLRMDLINPDNDLENDVHNARDSLQEFGRTPNPVKQVQDTERAIEDTRALAAHLISALELTTLGNGERAAALMEAMRHVGRSLVNERPLHKSDATVVCLSTLPPNYQRPDWFSEAFAEWLAYRLGQEEAKNELGQNILDYEYGL